MIMTDDAILFYEILSQPLQLIVSFRLHYILSMCDLNTLLHEGILYLIPPNENNNNSF
jgi:hypothetical protein